MTRLDAIYEMLCAISGIAVRRDEPMSRHTTLQLGGPVDLFVQYDSAPALVEAASVLERESCPWFPVGFGSNLLVMDQGIEGAILVPGSPMTGIEFSHADEPTVTAGCGTGIGPLLQAIGKSGYSGLEFLTGIPGTVGGAVAMNAGTRYGWIQDALISVTVASAGGMRDIATAALGLGYRRSAVPTGSVITGATFRLSRGPSEEGALVARTLSELRRNNHPPASGTAGSFFRNPDPAANLFAGQLIEECGLKGFSKGGAVVSPKHANFLMNGGGATAADLLGLALLVRNRVLEEKGVALTREVRVVGRGSREWQDLLP
ncbi:MAG TPA: UDP-N-acetylmuramate dehydrogenase [Myxococcota bacterium]|nr:UDP-N-acetylmuramate dehydrogenase [Myxococcota bacterium]HOH76195.1 UDP-N-acetylmuramate dehydrogenase [Myxococcota bacterium]